jgi:hypothetical protein
VRALAVEFAPKRAALDEFKHGLGGGGTPRFVAFGRGQSVQTDRQSRTSIV